MGARESEKRVSAAIRTTKEFLFTFPGPPVSCEKAPTSSTPIPNVNVYTLPLVYALFCLRLNGDPGVCIYTHIRVQGVPKVVLTGTKNFGLSVQCAINGVTNKD